MTKLRALLSLFAGFLKVAFLPNFRRSLTPMGDSYYNFGRTLAGVFTKVDLIEPTHPWLRSSIRVRPLEVLSYVCAKADWKKPLSLPTVMAASVTLLTICASISLVGLLTTTLLGAGSAYASMFVPESPSTDMALRYMTNAFGITIENVPAGALDGVVKGFQQILAMYSSAMLILAGFILLYILVSAIAATAHEGRFGGSGFNQIWTPIRLITAIGLLVPLPMAAGYNGYNTGQYVVMKVAEWGSGMASNLWVPFATSLAERGDVIATPNVTPLAPVVQGVVLNEFCMARYNGIKAMESLMDPPVTIKTITSGGVIKKYYTTSSDTQNDFCGVVTYQKVLSGNPMAISISNGFETAFNNMRTAVQAFAEQLNGPNYIQLDSGLPAAGQEEALKQFFVQQFVHITDNYQKDLKSVIEATVATQSTVAQNEMTTAIKQQGWAGAAIWFNTIARINSEVMAASRGIPSTQVPSLGNAATTTGSAKSPLAQKVEVGMALLASLLGNIQAMYADAGLGSQTYGASNTGSVYTPAVAAGLDNTGSVLGSISGGFGDFLSVIFTKTFFGGPFGDIGVGAEANLSQINPLAQLAQIGDWLVDKSLWMIGLGVGGSLLAALPFVSKFVDIPMIAVMVLFTFGMMGLSAGLLLLYVTPLMPFIRFLFGVVGWLLNILEAIIAIPLVAVAHLNTRGEGLSGDLARTAYFMVLSIFLRPALLIVGMVIALMMFSVAIGILNETYKAAVVGFMGTASGGAGGGFSIFVYTLMYVAIAYGLCNLCFKLIEDIPNHAMKWISQQSAREITQDEGVARAVTGNDTQSMFMLGRNVGEKNFGYIRDSKNPKPPGTPAPRASKSSG